MPLSYQYVTARAYLGLHDRRGEPVPQAVVDGLTSWALAHYCPDGATAWRAMGVYSGNGEPAREPTLMVEVCGPYGRALPQLRALAKAWCETADQECVLISTTESGVETVHSVDVPAHEEESIAA